MTEFWQRCRERLARDLTPQQFNTWIRPLTASETADGLEIQAPNRVVMDWIRDKFGERIDALVVELSNGRLQGAMFVVNAGQAMPTREAEPPPAQPASAPEPVAARPEARTARGRVAHAVRSDFTFDNFVMAAR